MGAVDTHLLLRETRSGGALPTDDMALRGDSLYSLRGRPDHCAILAGKGRSAVAGGGACRDSRRTLPACQPAGGSGGRAGGAREVRGSASYLAEFSEE